MSHEVLEACEGKMTGIFIPRDRFKFISCDHFEQGIEEEWFGEFNRYDFLQILATISEDWMSLSSESSLNMRMVEESETDPFFERE